MGDFFQPWHLLVLGIVGSGVVLITVLPFWQIFKKAGFPPALSLLMLGPFVGVVVLFVLAFSEWPSLKGPQKRNNWIPPGH